MKQRFFSTLLFSVLFLFALTLRGDISYTSSPSVGTDFSSFTKYVDVVTGAESWYRDWIGGTVTVYVSADMEGVGQGQGTLTNISIFGNSIGTWQDSTSMRALKVQTVHGVLGRVPPMRRTQHLFLMMPLTVIRGHGRRVVLRTFGPGNGMRRPLGAFK